MPYPIGPLAILPLKNTVVYPGVSQALRVGREKSVKALKKAFEQQNWILTTTQKSPNQSVEQPEDVYATGVLSRIEDVRGSTESGYQIVVKGSQRVLLKNVQNKEGYFMASFEPVEDISDLERATQKALISSVKQVAKEVLSLVPANTESLNDMIEPMDDLQELTYFCAAQADFDLKEKQKILETLSIRERTFTILSLLQELKNSLQVQADIRQKLSNKFGQTHRQQILREQLRAIKEELGEAESESNEVFRKRLDEAHLPPEALELAEQQLSRLEEMTSSSPEYHVIRSHLELMISLPWSKSSEEVEIDLEKARGILDEDD